jgi:hypothetical protein
MIKMDILSAATPEQILPTIGTIATVSAFTFITEQAIIVTIRAYKCQITYHSSKHAKTISSVHLKTYFEFRFGGSTYLEISG